MTTHNHKHNPETEDVQHSESQIGLAEQIKTYVDEALDKYGKKYACVHDAVEEVSDSLIKTTKKKPLLALGVAVVCGVLLGKILK